MTDKIDFVIPWVDGKDEEWRKKKNSYLVAQGEDASDNRYREWENLQYWFRGVEKFAPWVNKIHFITEGHLPKWLNENHPKLHIVRHEDYIPGEYLPVFSANPIELNMHRIEGLSEKFVYFNDDLFLTGEVQPEDFFKKDLPLCMGVICPYMPAKDVFSKLICNDIGVINAHFCYRESLKKHWKKWYSPKYGKRMLMSMLMFPYPNFSGFLNTHSSNSYLKSTFEKVWKEEEEILKETCKHRFRDPQDVNQHLMKYWQMAEGNFYPCNEEKRGHYYSIGKDTQQFKKDVEQSRYKLACLNDVDTEMDFEKEKQRLKDIFETILPEKSAFER